MEQTTSAGTGTGFDPGPVDAYDGQQTADALVAGLAVVVGEEARQLLRVAHWADLHNEDSIEVRRDGAGRVLPGTERAKDYGGAGTPKVAEFATCELAVLLGISDITADNLVRDTLDLRHRHPRLWHSLCHSAHADDPDRNPALAAAATRVWQARKVASLCHAAGLTLLQTVWVDAVTTPLFGTMSWSAFEHEVKAKIIDADPAAAEARRREAEGTARVTLGRTNEHGLKTLIIQAAAGDILSIHAAADRIAQCLALEGDTDPANLRLVKAYRIMVNSAETLKLLLRHALLDHDTDPADGPADTDSEDPNSDGTGDGEEEEGDPGTDLDTRDHADEGDTTNSDSAPGTDLDPVETVGGSDGSGSGTDSGSRSGAVAVRPRPAGVLDLFRTRKIRRGEPDTGPDDFTPPARGTGRGPFARRHDEQALADHDLHDLPESCRAPDLHDPVLNDLDTYPSTWTGPAGGGHASGPAATGEPRGPFPGPRGGTPAAPRGGVYDQGPPPAHGPPSPAMPPTATPERHRSHASAHVHAPHADLPLFDPTGDPAADLLHLGDLHPAQDDSDDPPTRHRGACAACGWLGDDTARDLIRTLDAAIDRLDPARLRPRTVLYVHVSEDSFTRDQRGAARFANGGTGPLTPGQLIDLLGHTQVEVRPVIDLPTVHPINCYQATDRLREAVQLANPISVFPFATNSSRAANVDLDHPKPYRHKDGRTAHTADDNPTPGDDTPADQRAAGQSDRQSDADSGWEPGQTGLHNLAPLHRKSHRVKTFANGWTHHNPAIGVHYWRSPHGYSFRVDTTGTHPLGRRTMTEFLDLAHRDD